MNERVAFFGAVNSGLAAKLLQRLHSQVKAFPDVFRMSRITRHRWRFDETTQQRFKFLSMLLSIRIQLISIERCWHSGVLQRNVGRNLRAIIYEVLLTARTEHR